MVADKIFDLSISSKLVYQSDIPIKGKTFVKVFIDRAGEGTWEVIDGNNYQLINDSLVFTERPTGSLLIMQVATTPSELQQTPTDTSLLLTIKEEIKTLVANLGEIVVVSDSIDKVIVVADNIIPLSSIYTDIVPNLTEILQADTNAQKASTSAAQALRYRNEAEAFSISNVFIVNTIEDLVTIPSNYTTAIVKDPNRSGTFIWSATGTANGGTVFAGATGFWNRQYSGDVNVKWFGAVGDGVKDDRIAFQLAFEHAASAGKTLYIPSGNFLLDSIDATNPYGCAVFVATDSGMSVNCSGGASIVAGAGLGAAIAGYLGHGAVIRIQRVSDVTGSKVTWSGGRFDLSALPSGTTGCDGLSIGPKYLSVNIDGVMFDHGVTSPVGINPGVGGGDSSFYCKEPESISITNCQFFGAPDIGIYLSGDDNYPARIGRHAYIAGNYFYRCQNGIAAKRDFQNTIIQGNCFLENAGGIFLGVADGSLINTGKRIIVNGNVITKTQGNPIRITNSQSAIVTGNEIFDYRRLVSDGVTEIQVTSGNIGGAILLQGVKNFSVTGNSIGFNEWTPVSTTNKFSAGVSLSTYAGTGLGCSNGVVIGNSIRSVYCAFYLSNECFGITLSPNSISGVMFSNVLGTGANNTGVDLLGETGTGIKWIANGIWSATGNNAEIARFSGVTNAVNRVELVNSVSGAPVELRAKGSDVFIDLALVPRGSGGVVRFGTHTDHADAPISGFITIKDSSGVTRKLAVIE